MLALDGDDESASDADADADADADDNIKMKTLHSVPAANLFLPRGEARQKHNILFLTSMKIMMMIFSQENLISFPKKKP